MCISVCVCVLNHLAMSANRMDCRDPRLSKIGARSSVAPGWAGAVVIGSGARRKGQAPADRNLREVP